MGRGALYEGKGNGDKAAGSTLCHLGDTVVHAGKAELR